MFYRRGKWKWRLISPVQFFATPWTIAHHWAPLSMEFSTQEYWSRCHFLLQGFFPTQGLNLGPLHCRHILYHLNHCRRGDMVQTNRKKNTHMEVNIYMVPSILLPWFDPWVGKIPWRREWLPTPVFLPEEFHGQWAWWATARGVTQSRLTSTVLVTYMWYHV